MSKKQVQIQEGNTGYLTVSLLVDLLNEIRALREDLGALILQNKQSKQIESE